ncbi:MAG TPA: hypothetical protein P5079_10370, partial [Elusimicrobiota bacterium]|nr:hypothetical protein [Elusimicrobiota bacterium]
TGLLKSGEAAAAAGRGESIAIDSFGNVTFTETKQTYTAVRNQAKLDTATTSSFTESVDGSTTTTDPYNTKYEYDEAGRLVRAYLTGEIHRGESGRPYFIHSVTLDAYGNVTHSYSNQEFIILAGQAKLDTVTAESVSSSVDGSVTVTDPYVTSYSYYEDSPENRALRRVGNLSAAALVGLVHSTTTDAYGNISQSWTKQVFEVIAGQAKLVETETSSAADSVDGAHSETKPYVTKYEYDARGLLARVYLAGQTYAAPSTETDGQGYFIYSRTEDAFGNVSESWSNQTFEVVAGQAKMSSVTSEALGTTVDGSRTVTKPYTIEYRYVAWQDGLASRTVGHLAWVTPEVNVESVATDSFSNVTNSTAIQRFEVLASIGQAKMMSVTSSSVAESVDGTTTTTDPYLMEYHYDPATGLLERVNLAGPTQEVAGRTYFIHSRSEDSFGNVTDSWSNQIYVVIAGQAKMVSVTTTSHAVSVDGTLTDTDPYTIAYAYDGEGVSPAEMRERVRQDREAGRPLTIGHLTDVGDPRVVSISTDFFGNVTMTQSEQDFEVHAPTGQAKLMFVATASVSMGVDGATTITDRYVTQYHYENTGLLVSANLTGPVSGARSGNAYYIHATTEDAFGNVTHSWSNQVFDVVIGQAKLTAVTSESLSFGLDGTTTVTSPYTIAYRYKSLEEGRASRTAGHMKWVTPEVNVHSQTTDPFGNITSSLAIQHFEVMASIGQAKMTSVTSSSIMESVDGSVSVTQPYTTYYVYDAVGRLVSATVGATAVSSAPSAFMGRLLSLGVSRATLPGLLGLDGTTTLFEQLGDGIIRFGVSTEEGDLAGLIRPGQAAQLANGVLSETYYIAVEGKSLKKQILLTTEYDQWGKVAISGSANSTYDAGDGNVLMSRTLQTYRFEDGRLYLDREKIFAGSLSETGEMTVTDPFDLLYLYTETGDLFSVKVKGDYVAPNGESYAIHTVTVDAFGNVTESWSNQIYAVIGGQAKLTSVTSYSVSTGIDGAVTVTEPYTLRYQYNAQGLDPRGLEYKKFAQARTVGHLNGVSDPTVRSTTQDIFGNVTLTVTTQDFEVHPATNQAKLMSVTTTVSTTQSVDGSITTLQSPYAVHYTYDGRTGLLAHAEMDGRIHTQTIDAFGNVAQTYTQQTFIVIAGQAKVKSATTSSNSYSVDGSYTETEPYTITYSYAGEELGKNPSRADIQDWVVKHGPTFGHLRGVSQPNISSQTTDAFGNYTRSETLQVYVVVAGQAKLKSTVTKSETWGVDGTYSVAEPYATTYHYMGEEEPAEFIGLLEGVDPVTIVS